jgi:hypothetical protein
MIRDPVDFQRAVDDRRAKRMAHIDQMTPEMRELTNDYGYNIVRSFLNCGVTKPRHIRHLVETVLDEFSPTRGSFSAQGVRTMHDIT